MVPIGDVNPRRRFPFVTIGLIIVNILVFVYQLSLPSREFEAFVYEAAVIPSMVATEFGWPAVRSLLTSMFLHGSWMHILSNMLYLWIFGDNVEDLLGPAAFIIFYLFAGVVAGLVQVGANPTSDLPTIGASGAVAGILGVYAVVYPRNKIRTLAIFFYMIRVIKLPAILVLGLWFVLQVFQGVASVGGMEMGGVAWFAHIGGFLAGLVVGLLLQKKAERLQAGWR